MSGHSKWANIRRAKAVTDAKKGKIFTKLAHNITIAAQQGGSDIDTNFALRLAVNRARSMNMPTDNIDRAVKRGTGELRGNQLVTVTYEAMGPGSCALLIDCQTDNTNRALGEIRQIVETNGGKLAPSSSVSWQFSEKGLLVLRTEQFRPSAKFGKEGEYGPVSIDEMELALMEIPGIEDIKRSTDEEGLQLLEVQTVRESFKSVHTSIQELGYKIESAELAQLPKEEVSLSDEDWNQLQQLLDKLDDSDEVTNTWHNAYPA